MRTFLSSIIVLLIVAGCSPQKRLSRLLIKYPIPADTIHIPGEVRDSIIYDTIPGEIIRDSIPFEVPVNLPDTSITIETTFAVAIATMRENILDLVLIQKDTVIPVPVVIPVTPDTIYITKTPKPVEVKVKVKPKSFPFLISAAIIEFLLLTIFIFLLIKIK